MAGIAIKQNKKLLIMFCLHIMCVKVGAGSLSSVADIMQF